MTEEQKPSPQALQQAHDALLQMRQKLKDAADEFPPEIANRIKETLDFRASITDETDRGAVLMAAAFLDDRLKQLIAARVVQDRKISRRAFSHTGSLGTFSSRIDLAYLMGLIPKNAQRDLHTVRAIRNEFAHHAAPLSYDDEEITMLCAKLVFHGVKDAASSGSKFRRSVMGLLSFIDMSTYNTEPLAAVADYAIPDRTDAYKEVSEMYTRITGSEYPLKHEHE